MAKEVKGLLLIVAFIVFALLYSSNAEAVSFSLSDTETLATISVSNADDLYAYEINMAFDGSIGTIDFNDFLGSGTSSGSSTSGSTLSVYESRLDNNRQGVTGSGVLFTVAHSGGTLSLSSATAVSATGVEENFNYVTAGGGSSTGGGGGSSGSVSSGASISILPERLHVQVKQGESIREQLLITNDNSGNILLKFDVSLLSNFILFEQESLSIPAQRTREFNIDFFAGENTPVGIYTGKVLIYYNNVEIKSVNTIVEVLPKLPSFDVASSLDSQEYLLNDEITARIKMTNIGDLEIVDVVLDYSIRDYSGHEFSLGQETVGINREDEITRSFALPSELSFGDYLFAVKLTTMDGQIATSATPFSTVENLGFNFYDFRYYIIAGGILALIIVIGIISYVEAGRSKRRNALHGHYLLRNPLKRSRRVYRHRKHRR